MECQCSAVLSSSHEMSPLLPLPVPSRSHRQQNSHRNRDREAHYDPGAPSCIVSVPAKLYWIPERNVVYSLDEHFVRGELLGAGASGEVFAAHATRGPLRGLRVALKLVPHSLKRAEDYVADEARMLGRLCHPGVIGFRGCFVDKSHYAVVTELCGPNLLQKVQGSRGRRLSEGKVRRATKFLLQTLAWLHAQGVAHRDLKLENVVVGRSDKRLCHPKIIDWSEAVIVKKPRRKVRRLVGTYQYMAPESFRVRYAWEEMAGDVWAVGVMAYELLTGKRCFGGKSRAEIKRRILNDHWAWPRDATPSRQAQHFVRALLTFDTAKRPTAQVCLTLPFLR